MPPVYADDVEHWEPWQRAYRYGAFLVFPPPGIIEAVDALRAAHDPISHATCQAHISIGEPLPRALTAGDLRAIGDALASVTPFRVTYTGPRSTDPHPGVVYWIEPQDEFARLRALLQRQAPFRDADQPRAAIPAHMTIAEFLSVPASNRLAAQLSGTVPQGHWTCDAIEYAVPDRDFRFQRIASLPFGSPDRQ